MNNRNKQLDIKRFLYQNKVGLFGLVETKIKEQDFLTVLHRLGHYWEGVNNNIHHPGGRVWIIWLPQLFSVHPIASSDQHITIEVIEISSGDSFWYTVVYGFNSEGERQGLWSQLNNNHKDNCSKPWCICGDFNSLLNYNERLGSDVTWSEIRYFRQCVNYCEVTDIQAYGSFYAWNNKQDPTTRVFFRIDRYLINIDWMLLYPDSNAYFMNEGNFDHRPCICSRKPDSPARKPSFRYFNMWSLDPQFKDIIQHEWNRTVVGVKMYQVVTKLRNLKKPLKLLNKNKFSDVERTADMARIILDDLQTQLHQNPYDTQLSLAEREAAESYAIFQKAKISYLKQKSKADWLLGEMKTLDIFTDPQGIEKAFLEYYKGLLGTSNHTTKVHKATVRSGKLNTTNIIFIPKVSNPTSVLEFRPIACCNTIYKCIAKLLCNRLGKVLPDLVSINQGGFIKGRNIVENVLICQDLVRLYNRKVASPRCLVNIDLRKAYNSIEWDFLSQMLHHLKFPAQFVGWIMSCVSSSTYSLTLNGNSFLFFKGKCGLRQGDPLSPLLFTICMDYLSRILNVVGHQNDFRFHPMCGHLRLNHLLFADDLLLFSKGTDTSIMWLLRAFATFSVASGLCLNKEKTEIYFNGVQPQTVEAILQVSSFKKGSLPFKYLGVPISSKKLTKTEGRKLMDKITTRFRAWGANHLSSAGRLTLEFLAGGEDSYLRASAVSWDKCCVPKAEGGLGIKHSKNWNKALLGKYVWWITSKKYHLWVKWISHVYLKDTHWTNYNPPPDCSWSWKKIAHIMSIFKPAYSADSWIGKQADYTVNEGYNWLRDSSPKLMQQKLQLYFEPLDLVNWNRRGRRNSLLERNKARLYSKVTHPVFIVNQGIQSVCTRFRTRNKAAITREDEAWLQHLIQ
ncbi:uncharacterized protein LOC141588248 [Silene latifolia]|uniref:uncharacterized protein LOC141588248 n=1 Tax=Silene latifolia TaxID=37657 RepID=UPI003D770CC7